jgi:hypothetical protein
MIKFERGLCLAVEALDVLFRARQCVLITLITTSRCFDSWRAR